MSVLDAYLSIDFGSSHFEIERKKKGQPIHLQDAAQTLVDRHVQVHTKAIVGRHVQVHHRLL
jgi:hypothetical protein